MISLTEAAKKLELSPARVRLLCAQGRIKGAELIGRNWVLPNAPRVTKPKYRGRPPKR